MTPDETAAIDDAVDFDSKNKNGILAHVNFQNTVIRGDSAADISTFLGIHLEKHVKYGPSYYQAIKDEYPLFELVQAGLISISPHTLLYRSHRVLIAEYDNFAIGIAPMGDVK